MTTAIADPFDTIEVPAPAVTPEFPPSPAQVKFLLDLLKRKRGVDGNPADVEAMDRRAVSRLIDTYKAMPDAPRPAAAPRPVAEPVTEGMYRDPETGNIFKVQRAVHGSGNLYAKLMVVDQAWKRAEDGTVLTEGKAHFEYAAGVIRTLQAAWRMTLEQAKEFGALYGVCLNCSATLTREESIARGYGPVCAGKV